MEEIMKTWRKFAKKILQLWHTLLTLTKVKKQFEEYKTPTTKR